MDNNKNKKGIEATFKHKKKGGTKGNDDGFDRSNAHTLASHVDRWLVRLEERNYSPQTLDMNKWALRGFLEWCEDRSLIYPHQIDKPILESLAGRTNDTLNLPSGKTAAGFTMYYVTKTVIEDASKIKEFMLEQFKLDTFKVSYVAEEALTEVQKATVKKALDDYLEPGLNVSFERKDSLERAKSGKVKQFISYVK